MLVPAKLDADFSRGVCTPSSTTAHLHDPPPPPHTSPILFGRYTVAVFGEHEGG
jgi:hypothetical protein